MIDVLWFRRDLRLLDNTVLASSAGKVLPIFIFDNNILDRLGPDDTRPAFILHWVKQLKTQLQERGLDLQVFHGSPDRVMDWISRQYTVRRVLVTVDYDRYARDRDRVIGETHPLVPVHDTYLLQPESIQTGAGNPYRVFTPFYKAASRALAPRMGGERIVPEDLELAGAVTAGMLDLRTGERVEVPMQPEQLGFHEIPEQMRHHLCPPAELLDRFSGMIADYPEKRDFPGLSHTSALGPHLRFGTISIRQVMRWLEQLAEQGLVVESFRRQLFWREFYAHVLFHFPHSETGNFRPLQVEWVENREDLDRWTNGMTGVPLVDAGMRQLLRDGVMHNRARMVTASFLTKDLLQDWRRGEQVFARHLLDFDAATNTGSWQWASSTGTDAQPWFRVFNPWRQGARFDSDGVYIRRWVPELANVASGHLHDERYMRANPVAGYPTPMVDHREAAAAAVAMFRASREEES